MERYKSLILDGLVKLLFYSQIYYRLPTTSSRNLWTKRSIFFKRNTLWSCKFLDKVSSNVIKL